MLLLIFFLIVVALRFSPSSTSYHNLFIKEHSVRSNNDNKPLGQTLFVLNVPPYVTADSLKNVFELSGKIQQVIFDNSEESIASNDGFKRAYIVFKSRETLLKALKLTHLNLLSTDNVLKLGIEKWVEEYNDSIKSPEELQQQIDDFMKGFEDTEKSNNKSEVVDDEGWTVVTKGGRNPGISRKESVVNKLDAKSLKKMKKKELKNFYTFQIRESQIKNIAKLRKNYEEAKDKVKLMKASRKFKPY